MRSDGLEEDDDYHPPSPTRATTTFVGFTSALHAADSSTDGPSSDAETSFMGFISASHVRAQEEMESPSKPPARVGFTSALTINPNSSTSSIVEPMVFFKPASASSSSGRKPSNWTIPSAEALATAARQIKRWEREINDDVPSEDGSITQDENRTSAGPFRDILAFDPVLTPSRRVLGTMDNSVTPGQPFGSPAPVSGTFKSPIAPSRNSGFQQFKKPFKSPMITSTRDKSSGPLATGSSYVGSRLNPNLVSSMTSTTSSVGNVTAPLAGFSTPVKSVAVVYQQATPVSANKPKFVTPFLPGMRPGEVGRLRLEQQLQSTKIQSAQPSDPCPLTPASHLEPQSPVYVNGKETDRSLGDKPSAYIYDKPLYIGSLLIKPLQVNYQGKGHLRHVDCGHRHTLLLSSKIWTCL